MTFGWDQASNPVGTQEVKEQLALAAEFGVSEIDTARIYSKGRSEELLGEWLESEGATHWSQRGALKVVTKAHPGGDKAGLSEAGLRAQVEASLRALRIDAVDILHLHSPDENVPLETSLAAVSRLRDEGKVRGLGLSNYAAWEVARADGLCRQNGWMRPSVVQGMYNPATRSVEAELLPACRELGIRFLAYNPLAGGLLTGKHQSFGAPEAANSGRGRFVGNPNYLSRYWTEAAFPALEALRAACDREGLSMTQATYRWLLGHSELGPADGVLLGASSTQQLRENLEACKAAEDAPLPTAVLEAFDGTWAAMREETPCYFRGYSNVPGSDKVGYVVK